MKCNQSNHQRVRRSLVLCLPAIFLGTALSLAACDKNTSKTKSTTTKTTETPDGGKKTTTETTEKKVETEPPKKP